MGTFPLRVTNGIFHPTRLPLALAPIDNIVKRGRLLLGAETMLIKSKTMAAAVHLFTATGAICGLLALQSAALQDWQTAFAWLGVALIVDAVDGPLARAVATDVALPRFRGANLDLVIDYLNYCVIPAFIVVKANLAGPDLSLVAGGLMLLTSLFHFADRKSKTMDGYFVGFPAIWNIICFYLFSFQISGPLAFAVIVFFSVFTLIPLKWLHPVRVVPLRPVTLIVLLAWSIAAIVTLRQGFPASPWLKAVFVGAAFYGVALGLSRTLRATPSQGH